MPFFGVHKSSDAHLKFAFITGVTKFGQVSVFSDMNQLIDLSLAGECAALCGITEEELLRDFPPEIDTLARKEAVSYDRCVERIRQWYNGYRFHPEGPAVYNAFCTLTLFRSREFQDFGFQTGTPTFLVELLKKTDTDLREIDGIQLPARLHRPEQGPWGLLPYRHVQTERRGGHRSRRSVCLRVHTRHHLPM